MITKNSLGFFWKSNDGQIEVDGLTCYSLFEIDIPEKARESIISLWSNQETQIQFDFINYDCWKVLITEFNILKWPNDATWQELLQATMKEFINVGALVVWSGGEDCTWNPGILNPDSMMGNIYAGYSKEVGFLCNSNLSKELEYLRDDQIIALRGDIKINAT